MQRQQRHLLFSTGLHIDVRYNEGKIGRHPNDRSREKALSLYAVPLESNLSKWMIFFSASRTIVSAYQVSWDSSEVVPRPPVIFRRPRRCRPCWWGWRWRASWGRPCSGRRRTSPRSPWLYRVVQLDFTTEVKVFMCCLIDPFLFLLHSTSQTAYRILQFPVYNPVGPPCIEGQRRRHRRLAAPAPGRRRRRLLRGRCRRRHGRHLRLVLGYGRNRGARGWEYVELL